MFFTLAGSYTARFSRTGPRWQDPGNVLRGNTHVLISWAEKKMESQSWRSSCHCQKGETERRKLMSTTNFDS